MKRLNKLAVLVFVVFLFVGFSGGAFTNNAIASNSDRNVEVLLLSNPWGPTCTMGCMGGQTNQDLCVMCWDCNMMFWNVGIGDRSTCKKKQD